MKIDLNINHIIEVIFRLQEKWEKIQHQRKKKCGTKYLNIGLEDINLQDRNLYDHSL